VYVEENEALALSFTREELDEVLKDTKTATARWVPSGFLQKELDSAQGLGVADS
jgi:hypothetical protein